MNTAAPFWFAFLFAFSVPRSKHPRPSDARSPSQNPLRASQEVRTPCPRQAGVPFRRFRPVALGVGRDGTPSGQACTADSGQTKRNGAKYHVQQSHPHRPPRTERRSQNRSEQQREYVILQHRNPRKAGRTTRAITRTAPNGTASSLGGISRRFAKTLQKGAVSSPWKAFSGIAR